MRILVKAAKFQKNLKYNRAKTIKKIKEIKVFYL